MSRSYKKIPYCGDNKGKLKKRTANHTVRRALKTNLDLSLNKNNYKKFYETYNICDYFSITTWEQYWQTCWSNYSWLKKMFPDRKIEKPNKKFCYREWLKYYHTK